MIRVAAVQTQPVFGEIAHNLTRAEARIKATRADLYVLPELFHTGYLFRDRAEVATYAEAYPAGPVCGFLATLSREMGAVIAAGFPEKSGGALYNSAALFDRGEPLGCYRKIHLFDQEWNWFDAGEGPPRVFPATIGRLGPMVCFDWFFPETARCLALEGAQILVHMTNLVLPYCQEAMVTRCLENRVFAVTANRVGTDARHGREISFTGQSQITGPQGERLARAARDEEEVIVAEIDPAQADEKQMTPGNHIVRDRRPELYGALVEPPAAGRRPGTARRGPSPQRG